MSFSWGRWGSARLFGHVQGDAGVDGYPTRKSTMDKRKLHGEGHVIVIAGREGVKPFHPRPHWMSRKTPIPYLTAVFKENISSNIAMFEAPAQDIYKGTAQTILVGFSQKHECICSTTDALRSAPAQDPTAPRLPAASSAPSPPVALISTAALGRGNPVLVTAAAGRVPFLSKPDSGGHGARRGGGQNHLLRRKTKKHGTQESNTAPSI